MTARSPPRRDGRRFARYLVVGAAATALHYALLVALVEWTRTPAWAASGLGAAAGAQVAYVGNRHFTFAHRGAPAVSWPRFQATALVGTLVGMAIVAVGVGVGAHYLLAQAGATAAGLLLTFSINRAWTFS